MKKNQISNIDSIEYDYLKTSSSQDCTGLIPSGIKNSAELESYEELYPFLPSVTHKSSADLMKDVKEQSDQNDKKR